MDKLLEKLLEKEIFIFNENENLKIKYNGDKIPDEILSEIKTHKEELLKYLRKYDAQSSHQYIEAIAVNESYALSSAQRRLWVMCQLEEGAIAYNLPTHIVLNGNYHIENFKKAVQATLKRHEILRTVFREDQNSGEVRQWILEADTIGFDIEYIDLRNDTVQVQNETVHHYLQNDVVKPFDLQNGPLLRAALLQLSDNKYVFYYNMHHIISDGWSMDVLTKNVLAAYEAINAGNENALPKLRIQYKDYAAWQINQLEHETAKGLRTYWTNQLSGNLPVLSMPASKPRPVLKTSNGSRLATYLSKETTRKLKSFCKERQGSLFMGLFATLNALLYRYTNQNDLIIGTPVAGRDHIDLEDQLGCYVNTLALRNNIDVKDTFEDLFEKIRKSTLEAYENMAYPFDYLVDELKLKRDVSRSVVFDVMMTLHNIEEKAGRNDVSERELELITDNGGVYLSKFDMEYNFEEHGDLLYFDVTFNTDIYERELIESLMKHFKQMLNALLQFPEKQVSQIVYLSEQEQSQLLNEFNNTYIDYPKDLTILDLFREQVLRRPDAVALVFGQQQLTFGVLDKCTDELSSFLMERGTTREALIPVCLDRSMEMVIAIVAILKAGAAYVPVDPTYPKERIDYILKDTGADFVLSIDTYQHFFDGLELIDLNHFDYAAYSSRHLTASVRPDHLAYCIYTSGTTGNPKGVLNQHSGLLNRLFWMRDSMNITEDSVLLQKTPYVFDVSVWELTMSLITGSRLVIAVPGGHSDPDYLQALIQTEQVSIVHFVPSMLGVFLEFANKNRVESLKHVICSGEALPSSMVSKFKQILPGIRIHNLYGPTEAAIDVSAIDLTTIDTQRYAVSIGKPVANTQLYVVDESGNLQPVGVTGELLIGGVQVSRGYLNKPELTKEKFIENRFGNNGLLYRTGDLVRWLPDGNIEFLGRTDDQVKIRGYRIEPGEIESQLERLEDIKRAVVLVKEHAGNRRLVAYILTDVNLNKTEIQERLKAKLPEYMVPAVYIAVDEMPLTNNGKVDRKSLPEPDGDTFDADEYLGARTETESKLVEIWEKLLGKEQIGIHDNFFKLGGESIIAIQVVSRARKEGIILKVKDIFVHQTIAGLCNNLNSETTVITEEGLLEGNLGLLPIQKHFFEQEYANPDHFNQSVLLTIPKSINSAHIEAAVSTLFKQHDALRLCFNRQDGHYEATYQPGIPVLQKVTLANEQLVSAAIANICQSGQEAFSIESGAPAKFILIETPPQEESNRLFITIHHLAVDGVSWRILIDDLSAYLKDLSAGKGIITEVKTTSYRQWQERLQLYANSEEMLAEQGYWRTLSSKVKNLPQDTDYSGLTTTTELKQYNLKLNQQETQSLLQECHHAFGTEINDLLLAALALSLSAWTKENNLVIALEGHGREELFDDIDLNKTVGWFTSLYPVSLQAFNDDLEATIVQTKENLRAIPNKGIGYGILRYLSSDKKTRTALTSDIEQILFNYLGQIGAANVKDGIFDFAAEDKGTELGLDNHSNYKIAVNGIMVAGVLSFNWSYDSNRFNEETIVNLAAAYKQALLDIMTLCRSTTKTIATPFDYGLNGAVNHRELKAFKESSHRYPVEDIYRLSPLQEGILFHSMYNRDPKAYIIQLSFDLVGKLHMDHFKTSWESLIRKHSNLRTSFHAEILGIPVQCVHEYVDLPLNILDYSEDEQREDMLRSFLNEDAHTPFDLKQAPLFRLTLITLAENRTKLVFTIHHILSDGWSLPVLFGEYMSSYKSLVDHHEPLVTPEKDNFRDYINFISGKGKQKTRSYWKNILSKLESPSILPFIDPKKELNKTFGNCSSALIKGDDFILQLEAFAKENKLTINTIVQGAWAYLLSKYTNSQTVVFGTVISGRPADLKDVESRVGLYINTIPLCSTLNGEDNIVDWLTALQNTHTTSREEYGHSSLAEIQKRSGVSGELFDSLMVFENYPVDAIKSSKSYLEVENVEVKQQNNYALTMSVTHRSGQALTVDFEYNSELLSDSDVLMISGHFSTLMESMLNGGAISTLEYLTSAEQHQLLNVFNDTSTDYSRALTVLDLFHKQVINNPDKAAVVFGNKKINYLELDELSNQLANCLDKDHQVKSNDLVAIKLDRSELVVVSILAILKLGAAYVPVDPDYSSSREEYILNDSKVKLLITETNYLFNFSDYEGSLFSIDVEFEAEEYSKDPVDRTVSPTQLAYVIYTSGSTGMPKGVMIEHGSLMNYLNWAEIQYLGNDLQNGNFGLYTTLSFDLTVTSFYLPLISGNTLTVFGQMEVSKILKSYLESGISCIKLTPAHITLLKELEIESSPVELAIVGGDILHQNHVDILRNLNPAIKIYNEYGPTEATVGCMIYDVSFEESDILIGVPIFNTGIHILDANNALQPIGVVGELCIGGSGLARGYMNRPELTAEKFVPHPFKTGELIYKTGDLARWLPDGNMVFLGRKDDQVKIRGYRIELAEIEQQLQSKEDISEAVVLAIAIGTEEQKLVAYIVTEDERNTTTLLRKFLSDKLPGYMIPNHYILLKQMPLTVNGKIDKKALQNTDVSGLSSEVAYVAPQNWIQEKLAEIWQEHFEMEQVGTKDDYFQLGGDSIKMIRLISNINKFFSIDFPIARFYESANIESIAAFILQLTNTSAEGDQLRLQIENELAELEANVLDTHPMAAEIANVFPMSDIQTGMVLTSQLMRENKDFGIYHDQFLFQLGLIDVDLLTRAMELMVEKHETLRTSYHLYEFVQQVQVIHKHAPVTIGYEDISALPISQREDFIKVFLENEREHHPFQVTEAPLWRINLFKINATETIFVLQFHHAIIDGWSEKSLRVELFETYNALEQDKTYRPVAVNCSMRDSVISDLIELKNEDNIAYWKNKVSDYKRLDIFTEERNDNQLFKVYDTAYNDRLTEKCKADGITPKSLFFSAYVYLLSLLTFEDDLTVGLVAHRRPVIEDGEKLLGCFLNTVPFRFNMQQAKLSSWLEYIRMIDSDLKDLKGKDRLSLNDIANLAGENSSQNPFFDALFNYVDFHVLNDLYENDDFKTKEAQREEENFKFQDFERANTFLDFTFSITGNAILIKSINTRKLKSGHGLKELVGYLDNFFDNYLHRSGEQMNSIDVLSKGEQKKLLFDFNDTKISYPKSSTLIGLFEEQVAKTPDVIALIFQDKKLSYRELNTLSTRFANYLLAHYHLKNDDLVAVRMERSEWIIVAILGILKSGAAYVPIDPNYPASRISYMEEDSQCRLCLDETILFEFLANQTLHSGDLVPQTAGPDDLAYVIYTSGSTGNPKGVMIEHKSIVNTILSQIEAFDLRKGSKCLQFASFSFDASISETFIALLSGSSLYVVDEQMRNDPWLLAAFIENNNIEVATLPPAFLKLMDMNKLKGIEKLITAGELPINDSVAEYFKLSSGRYYNAYGPTEVGICGSVYEVPRNNFSARKTMPIGRPIANAKIFILDELEKIQPLGVTGEICIGGPGLSRGYLNRPELTSGKFIENPFVEGESLYKTGDLGKWLPDGNIEYLGRKDEQVKVRGYRIELGELESQLLLKESITEAAALVIENEGAEKQLVVYYVSEKEEVPSELRNYLSDHLPVYMLPDYYIQLEVMPLTSNGKIDKKALTGITDSGISHGVEYAAPRDEFELKLVQIWEEILKRRPIGIEDSFLEIGGNSIKAIQLISRIRKEFNTSFDVITLYECPTIAGIKEQIENATWINATAEEESGETFSF